MITYLIRRLVQTIPTLVIASILIWLIVYALPGDPAVAVSGDNAPPEAIEAARQRMGLDQSMLNQYLNWISNVLRGDFGQSYITGEEIGPAIGRRLMPTVQLAVVAFVIATILSLPIAIAGALAPTSLLGRLTSAQSVLSLSIPTFWVGILLILFLAVQVSLFPAVSDFIPIWEAPVRPWLPVPARPDPGDLHLRHPRAVPAPGPVRDAREGLRPDRPGEGGTRGAGRRSPRAAQRLAAVRDDLRSATRHVHRRHGRHRVGLQLPRPRHPAATGDRAAGVTTP